MLGEKPSMPYKEYLDQAEEEFEATNLLFDEGFYREAISRAYYSMFHAAQAILFIKKVYPKSHKGVIQKFGDEFVKPGLLERKTGQLLSQADSMRLKADYDVGVKIDKEECKRIIKNCEIFLSRVKELIKNLKLS